MNRSLKEAFAGQRERKQAMRRAGQLLATLLVLFVIVAGCTNSNGEGKKDDPEADGTQYKIGEALTDTTLAAIVTSEYGSDTLTAAEFRTQIAAIEQQFPQIRDDVEQQQELRRSIVEDFVLRHAVYGEADRLKLVADTARVEEQIRQYRAQAGSEEAFQQILTANKMTEDSLRGSVRDYLRQQMVLEEMSKSASEPTAQEVQGFADERAQQVRARHILFMTQNAAEEGQIEQRAQAVLDSIKSGADFEALAKRHSQDGTAAAGGDLGFFSRGQMVKPFEEAAFALEDSGDVTKDLVKTQFGYHIIQLAGRRTGTAMDSTHARMMMMQERRQAAVKSGIDQLRGKLTVRLNTTLVNADLNKRPEEN